VCVPLHINVISISIIIYMSYVHVPRVYGRAAVASVINNEETILNLLKQKKTKVNSARGALRSKPNSW
jgi:hypothetical protein